tara:strand:- start:333 stop:1094 length:762 start_codon:yes stop_codon:yes gene_type:complete
MQMKLLDKKHHLNNLNLLIKEHDHTPRSIALLTANDPIGYGEMSHQTIYDIIKGKTPVKYWQLQEFTRVLNIKINRIISDDIVKTEIIEKFDYEKSHFVPRNYSEPIEVIYFLNNAYLKPTQKAFFWGKYKGNNIPAFSLIDFDHKEWVKDSLLKERLINVDVFLQRKADNMFYYGQVLEFNKDGSCVFQWWKSKHINRDDLKFKENGKMVSYKNMWVNEFALIKDCNFTAIYPRITTHTLFDEDYKIEQVSL